MLTDNFGIVSASKTELLAIYVFDDDLFPIMPYGEWVYRCKAQGVKVHA